MEIKVSQEQGRVPVTVFHVKGEINAETSDQLQEAAAKAYQDGACNFLLDLAEVPYVSSYGIRTISEIFAMLRAGLPKEKEAELHQGLRDGTFKAPNLKLLNPSPQVQKVFATVGLDMLLESYTNLKTAVASF